MRKRDLAKRLVSSSTAGERRELLRSHAKLADAKLAREIKEICYARWTAEPVVARRAAAALTAMTAISHDPEIAAISFWLDGIAKITQSKFQQAIDRLDAGAAAFNRLDKPVDAAQTQVAKLIALALLGRYEEADEAGKSALAIFEKARDQLAAGKIEMNLSNVAARREMHRDAERYALSALRRFKKIGEKTWQTMAENDLANTYSEINEFRKAESYFAMAAKSARESKMRLTLAEIEASMGNLEMFRGRYADALKFLELSRQNYDELGLPHQSAIADLEIAEICAELNLVVEASSKLHPLAERLKKLGLKADEARARTIVARLLTRQGEYRSALKELARARQLFSKENNAIGQARTDILRAEVLISTSDHEKAETALDQARQCLAGSRNNRWTIMADLLRAETYRLRGKYASSRQLLKSVVKSAGQCEMPSIAAAGLTALGKLESSIGDVAGAKSAFGRAVALIESMRAPIASDEFKMSFLAGQLEPFEELFRIAVGENRIAEAFDIHELARARSLVEAVGTETNKRSSGKLATTLEKVREELNWFYSRLARAGDSDISDLEVEIASREKLIASLTRQIDSLTGNRAREEGKVDVTSLQSRLKGDTALIEYVELNGTIAAFVVTNKSIDLVQGLGNENFVKRDLEGLRFQFGSLRFGREAVKNFLPQLKQNADRYLERLYQTLIAPVAHLVNNKKLVIAPSGSLNYIPFNALFDGERYLIESHVVSITPSAGVWMKLNKRRPQKIENGLLMGYSDESIPLAEAEIGALREELDTSATAFTGREATFRAFVDNASKADLIHLACHGQFRSDNPMFSSLHLADGWVTVRDVTRQKLKAELVILSACETGLSEIHAGEELLGLTRGFLSAGAQNLIVSLWTVNDESTSQLMTEFYTNLQRGTAPAASLRAAQIKFIDAGVHPYYWSSFISIGK